MALGPVRIERHDSLRSTQGRAVELARDGAPSGTVVVAAAQTGGVGRADHTWWSPPGGLYLSAVLPLPAHRAPLLTLGVAAELASELERSSLELRVKWPNDLVVPEGDGGYRKLGGLLADSVPSPALGTAVVLGLGLNVGPPGPLPSDLVGRHASLAERDGPPLTLYESEVLALRVIGHVATGLDTPEGAATVLEAARERLFGMGRDVRVDGRPAGRVVGLTDEGALRVHGPRGVAEIRAGDLTFEGPS